MPVDLKATEAAIAAGLPPRARWMINGTSLDFDFTIAGQGLRPLTDDLGEVVESLGSELLVFGAQDFAEGGGAQPWLCIRNNDGVVCGFDGDEDEPVFQLNSSIDRFIATFRLLHEHLGLNAALPSDFEKQVQSVDPEAYPISDWRLLVDHLKNG